MEQLTEQEMLDHLAHLETVRNIQPYGSVHRDRAQARVNEWIEEIHKWEDENGVIIY